VRVVEQGARLKLSWSGPGTVVVLDEGGAPFLRISPQGVETNRDSPDAYRDKDRRGTTVVPPEADGLGDPRWTRTSSTPTVLWHEHRAHWTSLQKPPGLSGGGRVRDWTVPLQVDTRSVTVSGTLDYVPGPSPLPYVAVVLVAGLLAALALRAGRVGAVACVALVAADAGRALGTALAAGDQKGSALLSAIGLSGVGWLLLLVAAVGLLRRSSGALVLAAVGGALVALAGSLPASGVLDASLPLTHWPYAVQRTVVAISLGGGLGLLVGLVAAFKRLSAEQERRAAEQAVDPAAQP
jgi:hypothetical protein